MWRRFADFVRRRRAFWASVPAVGHVLILAAAFFTFSAIGFVVDILTLGRSPLPVAFATALVSGATSVLWVLVVIRSLKFALVAIGLQLLSTALLPAATAVTPFTAEAFAAFAVRLQIDATALLVAISTGYALFIVFIGGEGRRYMRAHTEVALAQEIHRHLVPTIDRTVGRFEFYGASLPSSEVGGDLVDVVDDGAAWVAYVADVSGHGVASGALMGMFKSAVRTRLAVDASLGSVLTDVDRVVAGLRRPGMFVTCAFVAGEADASGVRVAVAGHPPILHCRGASGRVDEVTVSQPPIAMLDDSPPFRATAIEVERGDLLALVSDGLMEVFDRHDEDYGLDRLKRSLAANAGRPLRDAFDAIVADVRRHGTQLDDQSLLLVRVLA
jgi:serine phosphatase RsbU (regulator of sigma subunit)